MEVCQNKKHSHTEIWFKKIIQQNKNNIKATIHFPVFFVYAYMYRITRNQHGAQGTTGWA